MLSSSHRAILGPFLEHCDQVKFAEHLPSGDEIRNSFDVCRDFIESTKEATAQVTVAGNE